MAGRLFADLRRERHGSRLRPSQPRHQPGRLHARRLCAAHHSREKRGQRKIWRRPCVRLITRHNAYRDPTANSFSHVRFGTDQNMQQNDAASHSREECGQGQLLRRPYSCLRPWPRSLRSDGGQLQSGWNGIYPAEPPSRADVQRLPSAGKSAVSVRTWRPLVCLVTWPDTPTTVCQHTAWLLRYQFCAVASRSTNGYLRMSSVLSWQCYGDLRRCQASCGACTTISTLHGALLSVKVTCFQVRRTFQSCHLMAHPDRALSSLSYTLYPRFATWRGSF